MVTIKVRSVLRLAFNVAATEEDLPLSVEEARVLLATWADRAATEGRPAWEYEVLS